MSSTALTPEAAQVLRQVDATDTTVRLPAGQLDRKVYDEVNKVLTRIGGGGKWNRSAKVHLFPRDPRPELAALTGTGLMPADKVKEMAFFRTPPEVAAQVLAAAEYNLDVGCRVLEPSAGDGALVDALTAHTPGLALTLVETDADRFAELVAKGYEDSTCHGTFEDFAAAIGRLVAAGTEGVLFDVIVMNPPFSLAGRPVAWAEHISLAWELLEPGGRLVSIIPDALDKAHRLVTPVADLVYEHGWSEDLPDGAFKVSGTAIKTALVVLNKPGARS